MNSVLAAFVPPAVVTSTLAVPAAPCGVVQVIDVPETTMTLVQGVVPIFTVAGLAKLVPVIVIGVPPAVVPDVGFTDETVGAGAT